MSTNLDPDEQIRIIADDDAALEVIIRLGVFDKVSKGLALGKRAAVFHKIHWHKKAWILVAHYCGFDAPNENGWLVAMWPKSKYQAAEMDRYILTTSNDVREVIDLQGSEEKN